MLRQGIILSISILSSSAFAQDVSVEKGARIAIIGGCHDCHTPGYGESGGVVDPATALIGSPVGYQGPWGTTYAANLRLIAQSQSEDQFVTYLSTFEAKPPMPWFNVHHFDGSEMRSFYQYVASLGEPGAPAPTYVPPGGKVTTPYMVFVPTMPTP